MIIVESIPTGGLISFYWCVVGRSWVWVFEGEPHAIFGIRSVTPRVPFGGVVVCVGFFFFG